MVRSAGRVFGIIAMVIAHGCIEPYDPPLDNDDVSLLVIDGFLNATDNHATVSITRTLPVKSEEALPVESGAFVRIETDRGLVYPLSETAAGVYEGPVPPGGIDSQYRLVVKTRNNREYRSEYVVPLATPPIDSVTWSVVDGGVEFEVTTHDPTNSARNFRWTSVETFEYNANFNSSYQFQGNDIVLRPFSESIFTCWGTNASTDIVIGSTKQLASSVMRKHPVKFIPQGSIKLSVKYSLLVQQQTLSDEAYEYWLSLERSTEDLGGLFDPLPSEVVGNIRSLTDPAETVIGFFDSGTIARQRIFVARTELIKGLTGLYRGDPNCVLDSVLLEDLPQVHPQANLIVGGIYEMGISLVGYTVSTIGCADCRSLGGTTVRPDFWK